MAKHTASSFEVGSQTRAAYWSFEALKSETGSCEQLLLQYYSYCDSFTAQSLAWVQKVLKTTVDFHNIWLPDNVQVVFVFCHLVSGCVRPGPCPLSCTCCCCFHLHRWTCFSKVFLTDCLSWTSLCLHCCDRHGGDDGDGALPPQDEKLHRLLKEFGSNSWSSVSLHFKVSALITPQNQNMLPFKPAEWRAELCRTSPKLIFTVRSDWTWTQHELATQAEARMWHLLLIVSLIEFMKAAGGAQ